MRYYYGQLSRPLQGVYDALLGGFRALAPGIRIPMLDEKQLADVYLRLKLDEPLLFYVTGYRCRWMTGAASGPADEAARREDGGGKRACRARFHSGKRALRQAQKAVFS